MYAKLSMMKNKALTQFLYTSNITNNNKKAIIRGNKPVASVK
jgi:glycyl-tRNA synthetase beta subunit